MNFPVFEFEATLTTGTLGNPKQLPRPVVKMHTLIPPAAKPVTDADVQAYFDANKGRMQGRTMEQVGGQIKQFLAGQRETDARNDLLAQARKYSKVRMVIDAPRMEVAVAPNDPSKGPATAKVTIVEFSEFQ